ncbi:MAG TPA: glycosyltransferase family 1 protein [Pyrinomonadaceae bacterium]|nr:glycosyltransferase family 1 protein [Pyrinomonadaceae bacterium]
MNNKQEFLNLNTNRITGADGGTAAGFSSPVIRSTTPAQRAGNLITNEPDLVCFSHLRWDFVYQRPQHLLSRAARTRRVFVVEEPIFDNGSMRLDINERNDGVHVVVPHLPDGLSSEIARQAVLRKMVDQLFSAHAITDFIIWYYTPMALEFTQHLKPLATVYDCMDELSAFKGAPSTLHMQERQLFNRCDLVFTGGQSLYEAKRSQHKSVHAFPSSIDSAHFQRARTITNQPEDQRTIPHPRLGFFGVIDERFDIELLDKVASIRPDWQFVMIGPIEKIDPATLPRHDNIHYLGAKDYQELPAYLAGWDVALLLFARNEATRFISPTKTPEYLAAGKPVVSTSIRDVVRPYAQQGLVTIADSRDDFVKAVEGILRADESERSEWLARVDAFLSGMSWDETWAGMAQLIERAIEARRSLLPQAVPSVNVKSAAAAG